jgi:hypothetical protein
VKEIKRYREETGCSLAEAYRSNMGHRVLAVYEGLTGFRETNPAALMHHRLMLYGPPCATCGKPLRTQAASFCAGCGANREV